MKQQQTPKIALKEAVKAFFRRIIQFRKGRTVLWEFRVMILNGKDKGKISPWGQIAAKKDATIIQFIQAFPSFYPEKDFGLFQVKLGDKIWDSKDLQNVKRMAKLDKYAKRS